MGAEQVMYGDHWQGRPTLEGDLENFRNNGLSDGFDDTKRLKQDQPSTDVPDEALKCIYLMVLSLVGREFFEAYHECGVGNPKGVEILGKQTTLSDLNAIYNAWQISRHIQEADRIVEIGPGYGALTALLRKLYPKTELVLIDLPEHRPIVEYYLENTVGLDNIEITTELPDGADVVIALRCMMEMPPSEIHRYMDWIQGNDVPWFYLINRYLKQNITKLYPFDDYWELIVNRNDYTTGTLHEFLFKRTALPSEVLKNQLEVLPPYIYEERYVVWMKGQMIVREAENGI